MEVKKSYNASLESKRFTFFLLGLIFVLSCLFVGLQYNSTPFSFDGDDAFMDDFLQDLEYNPRTDQKDMVSAEAMTTPPPNAITQEVKAEEHTLVQQKEPEKIGATSSELIIGDGQGAVAGAEVKEAMPETPIDDNASAAQDKPIHFRVVQQIPEFPGGWSAYMQWLTKNLKYPATAQQQKKQGTVIVSFIVNKDGSVADVKLSKSVDPALDREALRVMRMMPKWKPGLDHDKVCRTMIAVPVVFKL